MSFELVPIRCVTIAAGGALGACLRHAIAVALARRSKTGSAIDPCHATLVANLLACFFLGLLATPGPLASATPPPDAVPDVVRAWSSFAAIGFCGSLSTFSTLCADISRLVRTGASARAAFSVLAHLLAGPAALVLGARFAS